MGLSEHHYELAVQWTGNLGDGTTSYRGYSRDHDIIIPGLPVLKGSADPKPLEDHDELRWLTAEELWDVNWLDQDVPAVREVAARLNAGHSHPGS